MEGLNFDFIETKEEKPTQAGASAPMTINKSDRSMNAELAKKKFAIFEDRIQKALLLVRQFEVKTEGDCRDLTEAVGQAAKLKNGIETKRKEIIKDADSFVRSVNAFVKGFRDKIDGMLREGKKKIGDFSYLLEMKRRKDQAEMEKEARRKQAEIDAEVKKHNEENPEATLEPINLPTMVAPKKREPIRSKSGASASTRTVMTFEVGDISKVPIDHLIVNMKKVKISYDAGVRVSGIIYEEKPQVSVRRSA